MFSRRQGLNNANESPLMIYRDADGDEDEEDDDEMGECGEDIYRSKRLRSNHPCR